MRPAPHSDVHRGSYRQCSGATARRVRRARRAGQSGSRCRPRWRAEIHAGLSEPHPGQLSEQRSMARLRRAESRAIVSSRSAMRAVPGARDGTCASAVVAQVATVTTTRPTLIMRRGHICNDIGGTIQVRFGFMLCRFTVPRSSVRDRPAPDRMMPASPVSARGHPPAFGRPCSREHPCRRRSSR